MNKLYYICSVLVLCALNAYAQEKECEWPKCYDNDLTIVNAYGFNLTCPDGQKCNKFKIRDVTGNCDMCLANICEGRFACDDKKLVVVTINGKPHNCPKDHVCNSLQIKDCVPCIKIPCPAMVNGLWTCHKDPRTVSIGNTAPQRCNLGSVCNRDYVIPCTPCIPEDKTSAAIIRSLVSLVEN